MRHANLSCPQEMVEVNGLWQYKPVLPGYEKNPMNTIDVQVEIMGVQGERALLLLPRILRQGNKETALVPLQYIN